MVVAVSLDSTKEENKFINLTSNLTHQLKQCIKNDNYCTSYDIALRCYCLEITIL